MKILSINIPTFERLDSFSQILLELESEFNSLQNDFKRMLEINVFENNSSECVPKKVLCHEVSVRSGIDLNFRRNEANIGPDKNIQKCCVANPQAKFTWVLGDDDHLVSGCLPKILNCLLNYADDLGILILATEEYAIDQSIKNKSFDSYLTLIRLATGVQPHFLIAHTLISLNIFRTEIFEEEEAAYVTNFVTPRLGLTNNFPHMRGLIKGLMRGRNKTYRALTPDFIALDTTRRLPSAISFDAQLTKMYYFYYVWLLGEAGIRIDEVARQSPMRWLFEQTYATSSS
jgi:hypothetical protein